VAVSFAPTRAERPAIAGSITVYTSFAANQLTALRGLTGTDGARQ